MPHSPDRPPGHGRNSFLSLRAVPEKMSVGYRASINNSALQSGKPIFWMSLNCRLLLLLTLLLPGRLFGLGIRLADQDPYATARGNAFAATADNPSAIYYNPAGVTQLEGLQGRLGMYAITLGSTYTAPGGARHDTEDEFEAVPSSR